MKRTAGRQVFPLPLEVMELAVDRRGKAETRTGEAEELIQRGGGQSGGGLGLITSSRQKIPPLIVCVLTPTEKAHA